MKSAKSGSFNPRLRARSEMTAIAQPALRESAGVNLRRLLRALLPALSLTLVLAAIAYLNPRAISYFGFNLMLNLAVPIALATMAQMFVIAGNDLDLSIGTFVGFVCCITATWLRETPLVGVLVLLGCIGVYAALGALIYLRNLPSIVVTFGRGSRSFSCPNRAATPRIGSRRSWASNRPSFPFRSSRRSPSPLSATSV